MRGKYLHRAGAFILGLVMLFGVLTLAGSTAQARWHNRVVVVPRVYIGPGRPHYRHWHRHWGYYRW